MFLRLYVSEFEYIKILTNFYKGSETMAKQLHFKNPALGLLRVKFKEELCGFLIPLKDGSSTEVNLDLAYEKDPGSRLLIIAL